MPGRTPLSSALGVLTLAAIQACTPPVLDRCTTATECPPGFTCQGGACVRPSTLDASVDAAVQDVTSGPDSRIVDSSGADLEQDGGSPGDGNEPDAQATDTRPADTVSFDSRLSDVNTSDLGIPDASATDQDLHDQATTDHGAGEAAMTDASVTDLALADTAEPDATVPCTLSCPVHQHCENQGDSPVCVCDATSPDRDSDGIADLCDACPLDPGNDGDGDGLCGDVDSCPSTFNPGQADLDLDGLGDACDANPSVFYANYVVDTLPSAAGSERHTSLVSDGVSLWHFTRQGGRLFSSFTGATDSWTEHTALQAGTYANSAGINMFDGAMAYDAANRRLLLARWAWWEIAATYPWDKERLVVYDIDGTGWHIEATAAAANTTHALTIAGNYLWGIWASGDKPLIRTALSTFPLYNEQRSAPAGLAGADPDWLSRCAQLVAVEGDLYGIKNDRVAAAGDGDRLFRFAPGNFTPNGTTTVEDLGPLPFEVGQGAALVLLPAGWAGVGIKGGLFIIAGEESSNLEGSGTPSRKFAVLDIESLHMSPVQLFPSAAGYGTSATFHNGTVVIRAGLSSTDRTLWTLVPQS
ncbi:MAG: hypothetical protein ABIJ09_12700 [Pseudomonadota bacterium]